MAFLPLSGVRVLDVTSSLAGPFCTEILSALGADVVKVERPDGGDETRRWGPPFWEGESPLFLSANAGKRSLALDLAAPEGYEALLKLADRADVVVQSLRPGAAERRGLDSKTLRERNPRLVHCSITAFGPRGPWAGRAGYDPLLQAAAGILSVTGEPDRPGVRAGVSLVDQSTGLWAALAVVAALAERERTGEGRALEVSLYETAVGLVPYHLLAYLATGVSPGRHGTAFPLIVPYEVFATADGDLMVAAPNDRLFGALCSAVGLSELAADERFATNPERVANREELLAALRPPFVSASRDEWLDRLAEAGVPAAPVQDIAEVAAHEQTAALGLLQPLPRDDLPDLVGVRPPVAADGEALLHRSPPPRLGEHSAEVLREAGYRDEEIEELARVGVVRRAG